MITRLCLSVVVALLLLPVGAALAAPEPRAAGDDAPIRVADEAPENRNSGPRAFGSDTPKSAPVTVEQALDRCARDVEALETDAIGIPFLGAAYLAFFAILAVFFVMVRVKQRRMEEEMAELKQRLARLQGGA